MCRYGDHLSSIHLCAPFTAFLRWTYMLWGCEWWKKRSARCNKKHPDHFSSNLFMAAHLWWRMCVCVCSFSLFSLGPSVRPSVCLFALPPHARLSPCQCRPEEWWNAFYCNKDRVCFHSQRWDTADPHPHVMRGSECRWGSEDAVWRHFDAFSDAGDQILWRF